MSIRDWKGADTTYLHKVQTHCQRHPSFKLLNALPHVPEHPTRIKVLEFRNNGITTVNIDNLSDLNAYWSCTLDESPASSSTEECNATLPCKGRLYLVEDISLPFVSALGSHFHMDPRFFVEYLKYDPDRTQNFLDGYHTMRRLSSLSHTYHHATFVYHEIRTFLGTAPRREEFEILTRNNVRRLVTTVDHHSGRFTGLIRRNLGIWWRDPNDDDKSPLPIDQDDGDLEKTNGAWDSIILLDPPMNANMIIKNWCATQWTPISCPNTGYLDGYLDFSIWPTHNTTLDACVDPYSLSWKNHSMLDDVAHYWTHCDHTAPEFQQVLSEEAGSAKATAVFVHRIMSAHWNLQLEYLVGVVSDLEKGLLQFEQMDAHPRAETITREVIQLRVLLSDVNSWRRRLYFYLEQMKWNIEQMAPPITTTTTQPSLPPPKPPQVPENVPQDTPIDVPQDEDEDDGLAFSHVDPPPTLPSNPWAPHVQDLTLVLSHLTLTQKRIQSLLPVVMGAFSLLEAQHSVIKADLTIKLSGIALVFVPLSFTASLLSMSGDFIPGQKLFWVFFAISVPLILSLFWWAFWLQLGRFKRWGLGRWKDKARRGKAD